MTPAGERVAHKDPDAIARVRDRGRRGLRFGVRSLAISIASVLALLAFSFGDAVTGVLVFGFAIGLLVGVGAIFLGWRRAALANGAERLLEQARLPAARVHRAGVS